MFSISEVLQILITILALSYILQDLFLKEKKLFSKEAFVYSSIVSTLSIVTHELAHKSVANYLGFEASYHASFIGLGIGVILRSLNLPLFFIPAYVAIPHNTSNLANALIGIAGPLTNLMTFFTVKLLNLKWPSRFLKILERVNLLLFIFNMIPFPGTDGYHFFSSVFQMI